MPKVELFIIVFITQSLTDLIPARCQNAYQVWSDNITKYYYTDYSHFEKVIKQLKQVTAQAKRGSDGDDSIGVEGEEEVEELAPEINVCFLSSCFVKLIICFCCYTACRGYFCVTEKLALGLPMTIMYMDLKLHIT